MLDRKSRKFLKDLKKTPEGKLKWNLLDFPEGYGSPAEFVAMLNYLEDNGYVTVLRDNNMNSRGARLAHKGYKLRDFRRKEFLKYIAEKWVDFFAMLMAAGSLVVSIIALLSRQ